MRTAVAVVNGVEGGVGKPADREQPAAGTTRDSRTCHSHHDRRANGRDLPRSCRTCFASRVGQQVRGGRPYEEEGRQRVGSPCATDGLMRQRARDRAC